MAEASAAWRRRGGAVPTVMPIWVSRRSPLADAAAFRAAASVAIVGEKKDWSVRGAAAVVGGSANGVQPVGAGWKRLRMSDIRAAELAGWASGRALRSSLNDNRVCL